jgi:DNA-binding transcriptional LysR family regulator
MDLRRLGYFVAVAEQGGFSAAARSVHVSQPALSLAVKELEAELGAALFERLGRRVILTAAGEALLDPARQALRDVETGRAAVASVSGLEGGRLTLAALPTLAADPVADLVGRFRRRHPGVGIELVAPDDSADLHALLRTGRCEVGFAGDEDRPDDLDARVIAEQRLLAIHPPGTVGVTGGLLGGLAGAPLVAAPVGTSSRRLLEDGFVGSGRTPQVVVSTAQRDAILPLVLAGAGSALVPEPLATVAAAFGAAVGVPDPPIVRRVCALSRPGPLAPAAHRLLELAVDDPAG